MAKIILLFLVGSVSVALISAKRSFHSVQIESSISLDMQPEFEAKECSVQESDSASTIIKSLIGGKLPKALGDSAACDRDDDMEIIGYADLPGTDLNSFSDIDFGTCRQKCQDDSKCQYFFFGFNGQLNKQCWTKAFNLMDGGTLGILTSTGTIQVFNGVDVNGNDVLFTPDIDHGACQLQCQGNSQCGLYQWHNNNCFLKKTSYSDSGVLGVKARRKAQPECGIKIRGVNLGGWLVLEKWMVPTIFEGTNGVDEWTLCQELGKDACLTRLTQHWATFITYQDIDQIIQRGLNAVRIPIGYWSLIPLKSDEPFVAGAWQYLEQIVKYAGSNNLIVWIDLHGLPGSQNGFDNSGHAMSPRGRWDTSQENLDRSVDAIAEIANRVAASPDLTNYVSAIELVNEPLGQDFDKLKEFYNKAHTAVRAKLANVRIILHDQFQGSDQWALRDFWQRPKYASEAIDGHVYFAFNNPGLSRDALAFFTCTSLAKDVLKSSRVQPYVVGEWSLGYDCKACKAINPSCDCDAPGGTQWDLKWSQLWMDVNEQAMGWFYWSWKSQNQDVWNYQWAANNGHLPINAGDRSFSCASSLGISFKTVYENL